MPNDKLRGNKLARCFKKLGLVEKVVYIKVLYKRDVDRFIQRIETAHKMAQKSKLIFKGA